jgi:large subunit ribosomal protein L1
MGTKRKNTVMTGDANIKIVGAEPVTAVAESDTQVTAENTEAVINETAEETKKVTKKTSRSKKYQTVRSQVDKTKTYDAFAAIELVKKMSYSKFGGSVEAHGVMRDIGEVGKLTFPHSTGKTVRVAIVDDELLAKIEAGTLDFDVLVAAPQFMPKLAKLAKILGPKGLMPNPKNGTLTPKPENKKKELEAGSIVIKTEKKAPLIHLTVGKTTMDTKELVENLDTLTKIAKGKLLKLSICASMSPSVRVKVE